MALLLMIGEFVKYKNKDEKKASLIKPFVAWSIEEDDGRRVVYSGINDIRHAE